MEAKLADKSNIHSVGLIKCLQFFSHASDIPLILPHHRTFGERGGPFTSPRDVARRHYPAVCKPLEFSGGFSLKLR